MSQLPKVTTLEQFEQLAREGGLEVVVFHAPWCPFCRRLLPVLEDLAGEYEDRASFHQVNVDEAAELERSQDVKIIPTVILLAGGAEVKRWVNEQNAQAYRQELDELIARRAA